METTKTGRPPRSLIESFRTRAWFNCVSANYGEQSPYRLEALFQPENIKKDKDGKWISSRSWDKYKTGERSPSDKSGPNNEASLIEFVGERIPESSYLYRHPIWDVMKVNSMTVEQVVLEIDKFSNLVKRNYFDLSTEDFESKVECFVIGMMEDYPIYLGNQDDYLSALDHLAINLMTLKTPDYRYRKACHQRISENIADTLPTIASSGAFKSFYEDFFDWLEGNIWGRIFEDAYQKNKHVVSISGWRKSNIRQPIF